MGELRNDILKSWVAWLKANVSDISSRCYIGNPDLELTAKTKPFLTVFTLESHPLSNSAYEKDGTEFMIIVKVFSSGSEQSDELPPKIARLINGTTIPIYTYSGEIQGSLLANEVWWCSNIIDISTQDPQDRVYRYAMQINFEHLAPGLRDLGAVHYT